MTRIADDLWALRELYGRESLGWLSEIHIEPKRSMKFPARRVMVALLGVTACPLGPVPFLSCERGRNNVAA